MFHQDFDAMKYFEFTNKPAFNQKETESKLKRIRNKIASMIRDHMQDQDMTTTETATATKMARCCIAKIVKNDLSKISLDRLLRTALRLGIELKLTRGK